MSDSTNTTTNAETTGIVDQIKDTVADAIKEQGQATVDQIVSTIKDKLTANGVEFSGQVETLVKEAVAAIFANTGEAIGEKVEGFLETKKDQWAALAVEDPDTARRKLRTFWLGISTVCLAAGVCIGMFVV